MCGTPTIGVDRRDTDPDQFYFENPESCDERLQQTVWVRILVRDLIFHLL